MNIGLLTTQYPNGGFVQGGIGTFFGRTAELLSKRGHRITVCVRHKEHICYKPLPLIDIQCVTPSKSAIHDSPPTDKWAEIPHLHDLSLAAYRTCKRLYTSGQCDVFLSTNNLAICHHLTAARYLPHVVRISSHGDAWAAANFANDSLQAAITKLESECIRQANTIIAPSNTICSLFPEHVHKIQVVASPAPSTYLTDTPIIGKRDTILVSSALEGVKGVHHAIEALADYLRLFPSDRVVFSRSRIGLAPNGSSMLAWLQEKLSPFMDRVQILPWLNHDDFILEIAKSTTVLLPSVIDNLPNVLIEAMSLGKLVIVTRGSSMDEFVRDGHSGIVAETSSPRAIFAALLRSKTMQDGERHVLEKSAIRTASRQFTPDTFVRRLEAIFEESIAAATKR